MKVKKGVFWGVMIAAMVLAVNALHYLIGGASVMAHGPGRGGMGHGRGGMGGGMRPEGGFGHQMMSGPHHGGGFHWIGTLITLAIIIAVVVFLVKWLKKKSKAASMQQFIDTSLMSSHTPLTNSNANLLDQWEKSITTKKENH
jgi:uncharacterized membrane protein